MEKNTISKLKKEILNYKENLLKIRLQSSKGKTNLIKKKIARILTKLNNS
ncbi:hypothetical protein CAXC1_330010 [Candidatus Xenohaliotis californiensis]|uniref:50S ribosomal protein L29 n=1 Tax=Candidatus Xenohaliotis californiensis TaxID=84677 RepID=A0ABP0ETI5_9RICK|nr:hypothetical protein CAXC1_330010 [Candidatus Xenohaliotis californiensis]